MTTGERSDQRSDVARPEDAGPSRWHIWLIAVLGLLVLAGAVVIGWLIGSRGTSAVEPPGAPAPVDSDSASGIDRTRTAHLFDSPANLQSLVVAAKKWTVTIYCDEGGGTGWVIDTTAEPRVRPSKRGTSTTDFTQVVITAEHVIRDCKNSNEKLEVWFGSRQVSAALLNWDRAADVATIGIENDGPTAVPNSLAPQGSWALTLGAPLDDVIVPVIGHVVHDDGLEVLLHMTIRPGNSGGPVINSRGEVIATIGGTILDDDDGTPVGWSYATPVEALCEKVFSCAPLGIDAG